MEPAPELVPFTERIIRSFLAGDTSAVIDAIADQPGSILIGTDDEEWYEGFETVAAYLQVYFAETESSDGNMFEDFAMDKILAWKEGSVGWIAAHCRASTNLGEFSGRFSFVVHEEGAHWRIVHWHTSIAVTNEAIWGRTLTTSVDELLALVKDYESPTGAMAHDGTVAIMFTDVVGSTALMEEIGEEKWIEILDWQSDIVRHQTAVFGGTVVKGQGDGFMLAFPAIGSAAACAVALQRALRGGANGVSLQTRMGIHCGNAKAEGGDFFGRTVVFAARLSSEANGGEILISQSAQEDLGGAFSLGESRTLSLKGLAGDHPASLLLWQ
ncbi:MAG: adenylate/guanylate cyclase domain-containing protein [Acidimicrobiales bacterium]